MKHVMPLFKKGQVIRTRVVSPDGLYRGRVMDIRLTSDGEYEYLSAGKWWAQADLIGLVSKEKAN